VGRGNHQADEPWYRTTQAAVTGGVIGLGLLIALVLAVVRLSDDWGRPQETVFTTEPVTLTTTTPRPSDGQPFIITPSYSSSTYTTSVPLSTTDIGLPTDSGTDTTTTTSGTDTSGADSAPESTDDQTTTTRKRPRLNETRRLYPGG